MSFTASRDWSLQGTGKILSGPGGRHAFPSRPDAIEPVFHARPANYREGPVKDLIAIVRAVRLDRTTRPWWLERPKRQPDGRVSPGERSFSGRGVDSLDRDDSWQTWEFLK